MEEQSDSLKWMKFGRKFLGYLRVGSKEDRRQKGELMTLKCPQSAYRDVMPYPAQMCHIHIYEVCNYSAV